MIIKTRKLPATQTEGERVRANADNGAQLTIPFPYDSADAHRQVAWMLAKAYGYSGVKRVLSHYQFQTIWGS